MTTDAAPWVPIPAATLVAAPWRNGLGISHDIIRRPGWTVSIADLERDAPFSDYPGMDRIFTPIAGDPPPELAFRGGPFEPCPLLVPKPFPGDIPTLSRIPAPGRAFNVITERGKANATVTVLHLAAGDTVPTPDGACVLWHCLTGSLVIAGHTLAQGDSILGFGASQPGPKATQAGIAIKVAISTS